MERKNDLKKWKRRKRILHDIIFEADTPAGKLFDVVIMTLIVFSILVVMIDSVPKVNASAGEVLFILEWILTIIFTVEYILRVITSRGKRSYVLSFYGIIDLLAFLPTYLSILITGTQYLLVLRTLRLLRIFRVLKLARYTNASHVLSESLKQSKYKITVFLWVVMTLVVIMGSFMYLIEGPENGFTSIPRSIYWAIVTLTTVGYGDIAPSTFLGQTLASIIMITGYAIIAVPTGIITAELTKRKIIHSSDRICQGCNRNGHEENARYCKFCGNALFPETEPGKEMSDQNGKE